MWQELEGDRVDAVALAGRRGAVRKDVAQVRAAAATGHFNAHHPVARVGVELDVLAVGGLGEARPAGSRVELGIRAKQLVPTRRAHVHAAVLRVHIPTGERTFGALLAEHGELLGREPAPPLVVADLFHRSLLRVRWPATAARDATFFSSAVPASAKRTPSIWPALATTSSLTSTSSCPARAAMREARF